MPHFRDTLLVALVLLISTLIPLAASAAQLTGVYQTNMLQLTTFYKFYVTGHEAAVRAGSDALEYKMATSGVGGEQGYNTFKRLSKGNMAMIGPTGTYQTYDLYKSSASVQKHDFIAFGPVAQTSDFEPPKPSYEKYIPQILWTMPSEQAQAMALLVRLAERDLFPFRQTFHRTMTLSIGAASQSLYKLVAPKFFCSMRYAVSEHAFNAEDYKKGITDYQPGIVYLYNYAGNSGWNDRLITDTTLISMNSTIATTFEQYYALFMVWQTRATTGHTVLPPDNFLVTSPVPGGDATEYAATQDFLTQAADWFRPLMYNYDLLSMMAGWASGTALMQALNKYTGRYVNNRGSFYNRMYDSQNSYVVSDLFIGTHGEGRKTCSSEAAKQGMLCNCNHAGNNIWLQRFAKGRYGHDITSDGGRVFQFGLGKCANLVPPRADRPSAIPYNELVQTPVPIHVAGISPIDDPMMENLCKQTHDVISRLSNTELYQHESTHAYRGYCVPAKVSNMAYQIAVHSNRFVMNSMMGVIPESIETPRSLVLDYIPQVTQPHKSEYNLVYLFPTLEQELYVLASYLRGEVKGSSVVCAAVKDSTVSNNIVSILKKTLKTFDVKWTHVVTPKTNLGSSIPASCTHTFVVGVGEEDAAGLVKYLKTNTKSVVFASFDDLTKYYSSFAPLLNTAGAAVTDRFVFATNLPSWTGTRSNPSAAAASRPLSTVEHFLQSVPAELHTPAALRAYVVAMLYDKLSAGREPSTGNMEALLYGKVSWTVAGIKFGPFTGVCMDMTSTNKTSCVYNYGARSISVWSYTRVVRPEAAVLQHPLNPSMVYESGGARANLQSRDSIGLAMEECIEVMQSSKSRENSAKTRTSPQVDTSATLHRSDEALNKMLIFMFVCLCIAVFVIVVMLMIKFGVLRSYACTVGWCGGKMKDDGGASALQMREKQQADILELQRDAQDVRRAPAGDGGLPLTFVCVDIVHFRELWVNAPELMSSTVAKYQHHVRQSIVRHDCYEMKAADGLFMIACGSADAGVSVARSCVEACFSGTRDAAAVDKVYAALGFGCGVLGSGGLRLRIAMHHGTACRTPGLTGKAVVRWSGGAVDDTVRAACFSRNSWQICVTECARRKLSSTDTLFLDPLGTVSLPHKGRTEIFAIREKKHSGASRVPIVAGSYSQLLRRLVDSADYRNVVASTLCRQHFASFLSCCCWDHDSLYLTAVAHCLGLPALDIDDYVDERTYTAALLRSVSGRLGALLECRHSVWSDAADREHQSGVSYSASVESSVYCLAVADSGSSAKVCKYK